MTLTEYRKYYGIKRINFDKVKPTGLPEQHAEDELVCPYCGNRFEFESEDTKEILRGTSWQCPSCEKYFYVFGEIHIATISMAMPDKVLEHRRYIEDTYLYMDKCEENGVNFDASRYGNVEWETYCDFAEPLIENGEMEDT